MFPVHFSHLGCTTSNSLPIVWMRDLACGRKARRCFIYQADVGFRRTSVSSNEKHDALMVPRRSKARFHHDDGGTSTSLSLTTAARVSLPRITSSSRVDRARGPLLRRRASFARNGSDEKAMRPPLRRRASQPSPQRTRCAPFRSEALFVGRRAWKVTRSMRVVRGKRSFAMRRKTKERFQATSECDKAQGRRTCACWKPPSGR
mmetsp:Transcript_131/g.994  ORF Transcript_131/g.994 Transcript_131/m.994 type:complete len:204 (-) Transcript_131:577-1188(-)